MWKRVATIALAVIFAVSLFTTAEIIGDVGSGFALADEPYTTVTKDTHSMTSRVYRVTENVTIQPDGSGNGIKIENGAKAAIYIDEGVTLTVVGKNAEGNGIGYAAIPLAVGEVGPAGAEGYIIFSLTLAFLRNCQSSICAFTSSA